MTWVDPGLQRFRSPSGDLVVRLGVPQQDAYAEFLAARARPNTVLVACHGLKVFFHSGRQAAGAGHHGGCAGVRHRAAHGCRGGSVCR